MVESNQIDMGERYKNWMETLVRFTVITFNVGAEVARESYLKKLEEEFYKSGARAAKHWREIAGLKRAEPDCIALGTLMDAVDDSFANWWDGYVENSPTAFEKHILSCPCAEQLKRAPVFCERMVVAQSRGLLGVLNPKATITWNKFLSRGDHTCNYRIEINP